jgi:anti-sigma B factor antagonist
VNSGTRILAGDLNGVLWLRVEGKGSYLVCAQLNRFATARVDHGIRHLVVDLESCPTMDSTFMGTLTGLAVRVQDSPGGRLQVVNLNERNQQLLENLGLNHVFEVDSEGRSWRKEREMISELLRNDVCDQEVAGDKREQCLLMRDAHHHLSAACAANVPKFRDVLDCLDRELEHLN